VADKKQPSFSRGDVIARRYEVDRELGSGMLGVTYLARHVSSGKQLALKVIRPQLVAHPKDRARFEGVFERMRDVRYDGVAALGEMGEHNGMLFLTEEYFPGQSLRQLIDEYQQNQKVFTLQETCQIVLKVLEAAQYLHSQGIVHRNLKPENVLVHSRATGPGGKTIVRTLKISDAGLADILNPSIFADSYVTRSEARYLAPELSSFEQTGTPSSDVYSIGVMLYEILVGQPPRGTYLSPTQLRGDLPDHVDDVVEIALAANPEDRYPSAQDMFNDIQRSFIQENAEEAPRTSYRNVLIGVGIGTAVVAAIGAFLATSGVSDPTESAKVKDAQLRKEVAERVNKLSAAELTQILTGHEEMLFVPEGPFIKGRLNQEGSNAPQSEPLAAVTEVKGYYVDRFEFPNRIKSEDGKAIRPSLKMTAADAQAQCERIGKRLCTEEEWEKACKGPLNQLYAYGDTYQLEACGAGVEGAYTLNQDPACQSGFGVMGMSTGPREWTSTQAGTKTNRRIVKGGQRGNAQKGTRCAFAQDENVDFADNTLSFRCCLDFPAPPPPAPATPAAPAEGGIKPTK